MLAPILAAGLWVASQAVPPPQEWLYSEPQPIELIGDAVAIDLALLGIGAGADLISTDYALNHGGRELNPLGARTEGRVALKMGIGSARGAGAYFLRRGGHKRAANIMRWVGLAVDIGLTVNNVAVGMRGR